jgi:hypothetical protein
MRCSIMLLAFSVAVAVAVAGAVAAPAWSQGSVSFNSDVVPILSKNCVMCHLPGAEQAGLILYPDPWTQLVGVASTESPLKRVESGSPEKSYLYVKLIGTQEQVGGSGLRMPFQQDALGPADLETIRKWIEQGAKLN